MQVQAVAQVLDPAVGAVNRSMDFQRGPGIEGQEVFRKGGADEAGDSGD